MRLSETDLDGTSGISMTACRGETFNPAYESSTCPTLQLQPKSKIDNRFPKDTQNSRMDAFGGDSLSIRPPRLLSGALVHSTDVAAGPSVVLLAPQPETVSNGYI